MLNNLYIENCANTEFISEPDVLNYLTKVRSFLIDYKSYHVRHTMREDHQFAKSAQLHLWKAHIDELIIEVYNAFVCGSFLTVSAMTRNLIEAFGYLSILTSLGNEQLIHHWFVCSLCNEKRLDADRTRAFVEEYCQANSLNFSEMWEIYGIQANGNRPGRNTWIKQVIPGKKDSFKNICAYLKDDQIYKDYQDACTFVHEQDIASKLSPFTFDTSICHRFDLMMNYIFKCIRLFPLNKDLEDQRISLELDHIVLLNRFYH